MNSPSRWRVRATLTVLVTSLIATAVVSTGCVGGHALVRRETAGLGGVAWFGPDGAEDRVALARWRRSVGPPIVRAARTVRRSRGDELTVISWNMALGAGDLVRLLGSVRQKIGRDAPLVLLLQEVYRNGAEVPATLMTDAVFAGRLAGASASGRRNDIAAVAAELDLSVCYIPSMRNGAPAESDEDRGNAVLSNLPLTDLMAIELPFERQRRVAVAATVSGLSMGGSNWTVRFVSAHLDNMVGARRGWFAGGEYARARQARGLVTLLEGASSPRSPLDSGTDHDTAVVLGGDFNTWFGFSDQAYIETARAFPQTRISDTRATFLGLLRLDHLFFRLPERWRAEFHRENDRFGSDHYPLVATIRF